jgi:hypothetical protein
MYSFADVNLYPKKCPFLPPAEFAASLPLCALCDYELRYNSLNSQSKIVNRPCPASLPVVAKIPLIGVVVKRTCPPVLWWTCPP